MIPFNKPYITKKEVCYINDAVALGHISGNGKYTKLCHKYFEEKYNFKKALLTTSCTDALEMCAMLAQIEDKDEVIVPSYTFVSTALAFIRQGAKIIFCDSREDHPGMNEDLIESLITKKTKAIIPVHYAGISCNMERILEIANKYNLLVIEDAAQSIGNYYINNEGEKKLLGTLGNLSAFSFHETKNIQSGEGGLLGINDDRYINRAEILWEKGTNRAVFFRGEVDKYGWVDIGSSFLPSEIIAAFLWAQLEEIESIQSRRITIWDMYNKGLQDLAEQNLVRLPYIPSYSTNNGHMYYLICQSLEQRTRLIEFLRQKGIYSAFHYQSLHKSDYYRKYYNGGELYYSNFYSQTLVRLPLFYELTDDQVSFIIKAVKEFFFNK